MLRWISILGGLLIMMGQHDRSEALFYYFRLEDQVPETHLLRLPGDAEGAADSFREARIGARFGWISAVAWIVLDMDSILRPGAG